MHHVYVCVVYTNEWTEILIKNVCAHAATSGRRNSESIEMKMNSARLRAGAGAGVMARPCRADQWQGPKRNHPHLPPLCLSITLGSLFFFSPPASGWATRRLQSRRFAYPACLHHSQTTTKRSPPTHCYYRRSYRVSHCRLLLATSW